jgi:predicted dehydrogenase
MEKKSPLKLGFIGCGRIANLRHLPYLHKMKEVEVVAIADTNPESLSSVAGRFKIPRSYDNHILLLEDEAVEAVLVCSPPANHFDHARDVLEAGRHLYVEPPLAISEQECDRLVELGEMSGGVATVGMNLRYHSLVQRARKVIEEGLIGPVHAISATFSTPSRGGRGDVFPSWRQPKSVDGNVFGESALQHFDCWRALTGAEFEEIFVECARIGGPVSMTAKMVRREVGEASSIVVGAVFSEFAGDNSEIRLLGRGGTISLSLYRFDGFRYCPALVPDGSVRQHLQSVMEGVRSLPQGVSNMVQGGEYAITFKQQLKAFVEACRSGRSPLVSLADGKAAAVASLAAFESLNSGQKVGIYPRK